jgi:Mg2+ and Co2+ transporter CorA
MGIIILFSLVKRHRKTPEFVLRDTTNVMDIYLNSVSNRLNDIMKVLTIISTIFIPLKLFAGIYCMNFHYYQKSIGILDIHLQ